MNALLWISLGLLTWLVVVALFLRGMRAWERLDNECMNPDQARESVRGALAPMDAGEVEIAEARHRAWL